MKTDMDKLVKIWRKIGKSWETARINQTIIPNNTCPAQGQDKPNFVMLQ